MSCSENEQATVTAPSCGSSFRNVLEDNHVPARGRYHNALVEDSANGKFYMYDACGAYVEIASGGGGGGGVSPVTSVNGQVGAVVLDADDISDTTSVHKFITAAGLTKLAGIETGAQVNTVDSVNGQVGAVVIDTAVFNVRDYFATGNNVADDTTFIQNAIDAAHTSGGGVVFFPAGTYKITNDLTLYSNVTVQGSGMEITGIRQVTLNKNGFVGSGISSVCIFDFFIQGNSTGNVPGTGTGVGIKFDYGGAGNNPFHNFRKVMVRNWGDDGLQIQTAIVSTFDGIYSAYNGGNGFNWYEGGTSCNFQACWARENKKSGYRFNQSVYQSLTGCAADNNGINYEIIDAQSIGFFGCGAEGALNLGGSYPGYGWKITNSSLISIDGWVTDNRNVAIWVTGGAQGIAIRAADNTPNGTAVNFIKVDSGCTATIYELHNTTANSLAAGTTVIINDGGAGISAKSLKASGASGDLTLTADPDAAQYNIGVTVTGALALFGTGGGARLDLNLVDGKLYLTTPETPASAAATGQVGQIAWDASYIYVCVATNTWKRVAIATW